MPRFQTIPHLVEATRWFKNGDHPDDNVFRPRGGQTPKEPQEGLVVKRYRSKDVDPEMHCPYCGDFIRNHGWIETVGGGHIVCPGDWIVTGPDGGRFPVRPGAFMKEYQIFGGAYSDLETQDVVLILDLARKHPWAASQRESVAAGIKLILEKFELYGSEDRFKIE